MSAARQPSAPDRRLRRRPWAEAELASLDFETTGLDLKRDHVVSFGVVPIRSGRVVVGEAVHQLVEPLAPPSRVSVTVHGIRPQDLGGAPTLEEARETLRAALDRRYVLAWYAGLELAFLRRMFGGSARSWTIRTIDVQRLALRADGREEKGLSLTSCAERHGVPVASPHDALDDALVTAQLFLVLAHRLGLRTVAELHRAR
ncbi:MAG TPA: 3'-5' exonuclease [Actinomycetota bacterium]|nr:3'-5' exonuclease [Actinomycetota bacterium]